MANEICNSLKSTGIKDGICQGAITSIGGYNFSIGKEQFLLYVPIITLTLIPLFCYGLSCVNSNKINLFLKLALVIVPTIPIYILGLDWGRWIHLSAILIFISFISSQDSRELRIKEMPEIVIFFLFTTPYIYIFNWKIPHFIGMHSGKLLISNDFSEYILNFFRGQL